MTAVNDRAEPGRPCNDTPELLEKLTKMKDHLKTKWKNVHAQYKKSKSAKTAPKNMAASANVAASEDIPAIAPGIKVALPYIPGGYKTYTVGEGGRDMFIEKLITKLQTPVAPESPQLSQEKLLKAIEVGKDLEQAIYNS